MQISYFCNDIIEENIFRECVNDSLAIKDVNYIYNYNKIINIVEENKVNIVFINMTIIKDIALEICEKIKNINYNVMIVLISNDCNHTLKAFEIGVNGYILTPILKSKIFNEIEKFNKYNIKRKNVFVKTFGEFDIFLDGDTIHFTNSKSKEFLAFLVDKCGSTVNMEQVVLALWPHRDYDENIKSRYRGALKDLRDTLIKHDLYEMITEKRNSRSVNRSFFNCDYYGMLRGDKNYIERFNGIYMSGYNWADETVHRIMYSVRYNK
ncbi:MAG: hypothetical protein ACRCZK_06205 [Oscillospiraceae bacterium]